MPRRTVATGLGGRDNAFGVIRLVLASAVIFSHAFPLGGWGDDPVYTLTGESTGGLAVVGFFAISGYLITKSGTNKDVVQFLWHRVLRIFPAFWTALLLGALVVGPLTWLRQGRALGDYVTSAAGGPLTYVTANWDLEIRQYGLLDVFVDTTPYGQLTGGSVLNGSLWSLDYEWTCYLIIAALVLVGVLRRARPVVLALTAVFLALHVWSQLAPSGLAELLPYFADQRRIDLPLIFLWGALLALYGHRVPLDDRLGALAGVAAVTTLLTEGFVLLGYPALVYLVLWLAVRLPARLRWIGARNDYSYGIYVYGFLVGQGLAFLGGERWGYVPFVALTLLITAGCAFLSWHLVEQPALRLKDRGPGRGVRAGRRRLRSGRPVPSAA